MSTFARATKRSSATWPLLDATDLRAAVFAGLSKFVSFADS